MSETKLILVMKIFYITFAFLTECTKEYNKSREMWKMKYFDRIY